MVRLNNHALIMCMCIALLACSLLNAQSSRVAFIGDVQRTGQLEFFREDNEIGRRALMKKLAIEPMQHLILLGDLTFWGVSDDDWNYFDTIVQPVRDRGIPMYPVLGNHEYLIDGDIMLKKFRVRFPWFDTTWYSRVIDSIGYVFLNTNTEDLGLVEMRKQYGWYITQLRNWDADSSIKFIVVCGHHPPFSNSSRILPEQTFERYFVPWFKRSSKAAFWFSGHCHSYERFIIGGKQFVTSGGGGGPRQYLLTGDDAIFPDEFPGGEFRDLHYCTLTRSGDFLEFCMVPLDESPGVLRDNCLHIRSVKGP